MMEIKILTRNLTNYIDLRLATMTCGFRDLELYMDVLQKMQIRKKIVMVLLL